MRGRQDGEAGGEPERDGLRALWLALPGPSTRVDDDGLPSADLATTDPATRAAVERLRHAWSSLEAPDWDVPLALRRAYAARDARLAGDAKRVAGAPRPRALLRLAAGVAVAAAAAAALAVVLRQGAGTSAPPPPAPDALVAEHALDHAAPRALTPSPIAAPPAATLVEVPRESFAVRADGFEFETQGVRFVLIETTASATSGAAAEENH